LDCAWKSLRQPLDLGEPAFGYFCGLNWIATGPLRWDSRRPRAVLFVRDASTRTAALGVMPRAAGIEQISNIMVGTHGSSWVDKVCVRTLLSSAWRVR